ncbi:MAG: N5-glutamine methyltransferase family protein [Acidimicrobiales bacterium]
MSTVREVLRSAHTELGSMPEARWIMLRAAGGVSSTASLLAHLEDDVPGDIETAVKEMVCRRRAGEPLQYVLGTWEFRELEVAVDRRALVPRPETEVVVACALAELSQLSQLSVLPVLPVLPELPVLPVLPAAGTDARRSDPVVALDLGTGSGVIALSLALECSSLDSLGPGQLEILATDASAGAIALARENLDLLARDHPSLASSVRFAQGDWFEAVPSDLEGRVHMIVSNPPYVSEREWEVLDPVVRDHEPRQALVAGATGREVLELLVSAAPRWLTRGGSCVLELAPHQADAIARRATCAGFVDVEVRADMSGRPRVLVAHKPR